MNVHKAIRHYDYATAEPASLCSEDGFEIRYVVNRCGGRLDCEGQSGSFEWFQVNIAVGRRCRVERQSDAVDARRNLLEQLQPLADNRRLHDHETRCVAAGPRQAAYEAATDWIGNDNKDNGNGMRLLQHCLGGWCVLRNNELRLQR